jgi:hypothetical protein
MMAQWENSYAGMMARNHRDVNNARAKLISDLKKSEDDEAEFDPALRKKILRDEKRYNEALYLLQNPEDPDHLKNSQ